MRKRALLAGGSFPVNLALSKFVDSLIKEEKKEERKKKRKRSAADGPVLKDNDGGGDSGGEGSTNRVESKKKKAIAFDEGESNDLLNGTSLWSAPGSLLDAEEDDSGSGAPELHPEWSLPKDTLVAIKIMCAQFPKFDQITARPFVLKSQLYSSVSDRTNADRELEELKQQQVVRIFKLNSGTDDFAVMLMDDYIKQIEAAKERIESKRPEEDVAVFDWFQSSVVNSHTGASIQHSHLVMLLSQAGDVQDKQISLLINSGLLVRQLADESTYWFGIPGIGSLLKSLTQGRKELTSFLARRRYKEMIQAVLEKKRHGEIYLTSILVPNGSAVQWNVPFGRLHLVKKRFRTAGIISIVDSRIAHDYSNYVFTQMTELALRWASFSKNERPTMKEVLTILEFLSANLDLGYFFEEN